MGCLGYGVRPATGKDVRAKAEGVHIVAGEGMVDKVGDYFLGAVSEGGDRVIHTQKEAGIVEEEIAGVFAIGYFEAFCFEFTNVSREAFVEGSVLVSGSVFC